ncbi:MAG: hypothetical protein JSV21_10250 [Nitrospirota bacterium]|nr:MAG: hypothetical protein JSV21_10250 [Nitrospirota bacterium]
MDTELFLLLLFILLLVLSAFIIPLLIRLMKMSSSIEDVTRDLDRTVQKLNDVVESVEGSVSNVRDITEPIGEIGKEMKKVWRAIKETEGYVTNMKGQLHAFSYAARTTLDALSEGLFKKKGEKGEKASEDQ